MRNKGFTLIELIIVMTIILVLLGFAVPGILNYQEQQTEEQFVNQVINRLRLSQSTALTKDISTSFSNNLNSVTFCDPNCTTLSYSKDIFSTTNSAKFNSFGELVNSNGNLIDSIAMKTVNLQIIIGTYGKIDKTGL